MISPPEFPRKSIFIFEVKWQHDDGRSEAAAAEISADTAVRKVLMPTPKRVVKNIYSPLE